MVRSVVLFRLRVASESYYRLIGRILPISLLPSISWLLFDLFAITVVVLASLRWGPLSLYLFLSFYCETHNIQYPMHEEQGYWYGGGGGGSKIGCQVTNLSGTDHLAAGIPKLMVFVIGWTVEDLMARVKSQTIMSTGLASKDTSMWNNAFSHTLCVNSWFTSEISTRFFANAAIQWLVVHWIVADFFVFEETP